MFVVMASFPVKNQCSLSWLTVRNSTKLHRFETHILLCLFFKEKFVSQNVQCDLSEGKKKSQTAEQYKRATAVWEEGNLSARYWRLERVNKLDGCRC